MLTLIEVYHALSRHDYPCVHIYIQYICIYIDVYILYVYRYNVKFNFL